ncbi:UDP-N-acetylmuramate--L-alanine ligase [Nocardioides sp. cx-173]|uniref:UDP-N-acetylmuramate--L-alanine ligase n=1 Tax=Nocardioides sp. cx-173 TaxID=2898796 RepID=UPI001E2E7B8A|nr:UDP-N-acetylmuramate--L-alanine ligase [Nocardioides sp. cx-173]MCD4526344.1 UDP-N-acetylmuramate--L-alanine ligase [Nocardioides sp. cx-173]UGB43518.1 UDP-N-acetylmuramate--L-alanine ligase [Nocardioides sp. cx-173]
MKVPVPDVLTPAERLGRVHFVGIGGAGLSGIARIMLAREMTVSGSDGTDSPTLEALRGLGARVWLGHDAAHVADADTVVVSTAVREDNPEYVEAVRRGLPVLPRSAAVAAVMAGRRVVAVAGTHGKTTTTSLLTVALQAAGADPTYAIGGDLSQTGTNAAEGGGELFVAEADESDGAFLVYEPYAAVVTNVEADHLDQWGTEEAYRAAFDEFAGRVDRDGFLVCIVDDPGAARLADLARAGGLRVVGVGEGAGDLQVTDLAFEGTTSSFTVVDEGRELGRVTLRIPGRHYVLDAAAALAAGLRLGYGFDDLRRGLEGFGGTRRRMEAKGEAGGVRVYDSYAHHPAEIAGDLAAARAVAGDGRVVVAYQPHLVSRTRIFGTAMGQALGAADEVVVLDVYLAREEADPDVTGALVADAVPLPAERVAFVADLDDAPAEVVRRSRPGDLVLTLGAGTVTELGPRILALLEGTDG